MLPEAVCGAVCAILHKWSCPLRRGMEFGDQAQVHKGAPRLSVLQDVHWSIIKEE